MRIKRSAAALLLTLLLCTLVGAQQRKSDLEQEGLKGRVKIIRSEHAKFFNKSGQWVEGKRELEQTSRYDERGDMVKRVLRYEGPNVYNQHLYAYDEDGNRLEKLSREGIVRPPNAADFLNGPRVEDGSSVLKWIMRYDDRGNRTEERSLWPDRSSSIKMIYKYDGTGRRRETATYRNDGSLWGRTLYKYDGDANLIELVRETQEGFSITTEHLTYNGYEFDASGNWIKRVTSKVTTKDGKISSTPDKVSYRKIEYY